MELKKLFKNRTLGFYLGLLSGIFSLLSIVFYILYGNAAGERNILIFLSLIVVIVLDVLSIFMDSNLLPVAASILAAVPLGAFVSDSVYTFVGYFFNLAMFGDASMLPAIIRLCVLMAVSLLCLLVSSFMSKRTEPAAE